jgi:hypothetical protein
MTEIELSLNKENNNSLIRCYNCEAPITDKNLKYCENCNAIINPNDLKWRNSFIACISLLCGLPFLIALLSYIITSF